MLDEADDPLEFPDADAAYLEAFRAATEMWGEALRQRRNPCRDYFRVRDQAGRVVLELPFLEVLESTRGGRAARPKVESAPKGLSASIHNTGDIGWQRVLKARSIVTKQQHVVERLQAHGWDTSEAETLLGLFTQSLRIFEDQFVETKC